MLTEADIRRIVQEEIVKAAPLVVQRVVAELRHASARVCRHG